MKARTAERAFNFSAGPSMLPAEVLEQISEHIPLWQDRSYSPLEVGHRSADFGQLLDGLEADLRELMEVPADYRVLLVPGGATMQFAMLPMNLLRDGDGADYLTTGSWSLKAFRQATAVRAQVREAASGEGCGFFALPPRSDWQLDPQAQYLHYAHNETIGGLMFPSIPEVEVPLVSDLSSCILALALDVSRFDMIYAGAQKNLGIPGLAVVVLSPQFLDRSSEDLPEILSYRAYASQRSLVNTPPTFSCYVLALMLQWIKAQGGAAAMERINRDKAARLYDLIDRSELYANPIEPQARSICNVVFTLKDPALDGQFVEQATAAGLINLRGHRSVGGMRASIYNAMPLEGVLALTDFMQDFERRQG